MEEQTDTEDIKIFRILEESFELLKGNFGSVGLLWISAYVLVLLSAIPTFGIGGIFLYPLVIAGALASTHAVLNKNGKAKIGDMFSQTKAYKDNLTLAAVILGPFVVLGLILQSGAPLFLVFLLNIVQVVAALVVEVGFLYLIDKSTDFKTTKGKCINAFMNNKGIFVQIAFLKVILMMLGVMAFGVGLFLTLPLSGIVTAVFYNKAMSKSFFDE